VIYDQGVREVHVLTWHPLGYTVDHVIFVIIISIHHLQLSNIVTILGLGSFIVSRILSCSQ